ncbi:MAG: lactate racemase domain-containing protein [Kiritimatiellae bacterium]|nr:lactate racemase domain-containing protein [Kiritimatiellia bacterium]
MNAAREPVTGLGCVDRLLSEADVAAVLDRALEPLPLDGARLTVLIPDGTRSAPMPMMFRLLNERLAPRARQVRYLIALGTHTPMPEPAIERLVGVPADERAHRWPNVEVHNHFWENPATFVEVGRLTADEVEQISEGRLRLEVPVRVNRLAVECDHVLICGPVFPHEVVGFSGGSKYFFPGIGGPEVINFTHWLGALITCRRIIGTKKTPVREAIERAAARIPTPRTAICMVVLGDGLAGLWAGESRAAWSAAADLSAQLHIRWMPHPFHTVLSVMPEMYDDLWTGAKGMYKLEPVVADGGELIIYAPHITEISYTHGRILDEIGYHVRDYFLKQWDQFSHFPWGVLAHSTHLRGEGTFENGVERPRIRVTLATGIPEARCRRVGLGWRDPATIRPEDFAGREAEGVLLVPHAGEHLYRLESERAVAGAG